MFSLAIIFPTSASSTSFSFILGGFFTLGSRFLRRLIEKSSWCSPSFSRFSRINKRHLEVRSNAKADIRLQRILIRCFLFTIFQDITLSLTLFSKPYSQIKLMFGAILVYARKPVSLKKKILSSCSSIPVHSKAFSLSVSTITQNCLWPILTVIFGFIKRNSSFLSGIAKGVKF